MDMRQGNLWKNILLYSIPLMFTNLLQVFFNLADVAVVGKFAGPIPLGSVGSTSILITLTTGLFLGMAGGVNSLTGFFIGAEDIENERKCVHTGFLICIATGFLVLLIGILLSRPILTIMGTKDELIDGAILYFRIYMLGSPALAIYNFGNAILSAAGDTKKPLKYLAIAGVFNIILNLIFVIIFHMASSGVALASIISQYISAILILRATQNAQGDYRFSYSDLHFDKVIARRILAISIPASIQFTLFAVANLFVQSAINSFDHVTVEGNSAAANADSIVYEMMYAFYTASTTFIAQNYGAGKADRVLKSYIVANTYSFALGLILGLLIFTFCDPFLLLFTSDLAVIAEGAKRISVMAPSYCISSFMDNATAGCRGLSKTTVPTIIIVIGTVVLRIVWIYTIFAHFHTLESLYLLYPVMWILTAIAEMIYFAMQYKRIFQSELH